MSALRPVAALASIVNPCPPVAASVSCSIRVDSCERRRLGAQPDLERVQGLRCAFRLDDDAHAVVQHEPGQAVKLREPEDERAEADPLDDSSHAKATAFHGPILVTTSMRGRPASTSVLSPMRQRRVRLTIKRTEAGTAASRWANRKGWDGLQARSCGDRRQLADPGQGAPVGSRSVRRGRRDLLAHRRDDRGRLGRRRRPWEWAAGRVHPAPVRAGGARAPRGAAGRVRC